jgi:hypothetical protein
VLLHHVHLGRCHVGLGHHVEEPRGHVLLPHRPLHRLEYQALRRLRDSTTSP